MPTKNESAESRTQLYAARVRATASLYEEGTYTNGHSFVERHCKCKYRIDDEHASATAHEALLKLTRTYSGSVPVGTLDDQDRAYGLVLWRFAADNLQKDKIERNRSDRLADGE